MLIFAVGIFLIYCITIATSFTKNSVSFDTRKHICLTMSDTVPKQRKALLDSTTLWRLNIRLTKGRHINFLTMSI